MHASVIPKVFASVIMDISLVIGAVHQPLFNVNSVIAEITRLSLYSINISFAVGKMGLVFEHFNPVNILRVELLQKISRRCIALLKYYI